MNHPRVLFVTPAAFNKVTGGGITFTNLFRGWPTDALATVHNDDVPVSEEVCRQYYRLGPSEIVPPALLRPLLRGSGSGAAGSAGAGGVDSKAARLLRTGKHLIFGDGLPRRGVLSPALENWIANFQPTLLYSILGANPIMELVEAIRQRFALPLVVHLMDDWPSTIYRGGLLSLFERRRMDRQLRHLVADSSCRMAIGQAMGDAYQARYGSPFLAFQNPVETANWSLPQRRPRDAGQKLRLIYAGSVLPDAQADSLIDAAQAVVALAQSGVEITLDIHSPDFQIARFREQLATHPAVRLHPPLTDDTGFFAAISAADILLLPVNFDPKSVAFIRYSMPTKVPAYLLSGTPILVYGPSGVAQVDYATAAGWAYVVSRRDVAALAAAIKHLGSDAGLRRELSEAARRAARANHDASSVRTQFQAALASAAGCKQ